MVTEIEMWWGIISLLVGILCAIIVGGIIVCVIGLIKILIANGRKNHGNKKD